MDKEEFKSILKELMEEMDETGDAPQCDTGVNVPYKYDKKEFISFIMNYGKSRYIPVNLDDETIYDSVSDRLMQELNLEYVSIRLDDYCIAIATPKYIRDAKTEFAKALKIIPEVFTEISGPMSTVLIIDCEKQYLRKVYLGIGESEWLL